MSTELLNHIEQIQFKVELMHQSERSHALLVNGPAGFGKTHAVTEALEKAGLSHSRLGSYSTPLNLFKFLQAHQGIVILDDVAGLFYDRAAMAILFGATKFLPLSMVELTKVDVLLQLAKSRAGERHVRVTPYVERFFKG